MAKPSKDETFASPTRFGRAVDVVAMFSRSIRSKQNQKRVRKNIQKGGKITPEAEIIIAIGRNDTTVIRVRQGDPVTEQTFAFDGSKLKQSTPAQEAPRLSFNSRSIE